MKVMDYLRELLASDQRHTLEFFVTGLLDVSEPPVDRQELLYNASILAHYAQVSTHATTDLPAPRNLSAVFDHFVLDRTVPHTAQMMEAGGAQCLLLAGFFEGQMRRRHNIRWYSELGAGFFRAAAADEGSGAKAKLLVAISNAFERWRHRYARLSQELRVQRHLLEPRRPDTRF